MSIRNRIKKWYYFPLAVIVLITSLSTGCVANDEQGIDNTVTDFFSAYQNRDYNHCLEYLSQTLKTNEDQTPVIDQLKGASFFAVNFTLKSMEKPVISGRTATIWVSLVRFTQEKRVQMSLVKEGSTWKIDKF